MTATAYDAVIQRYEAVKAERDALQEKLAVLDRRIAAYETVIEDFPDPHFVLDTSTIVALAQNGHRDIPVVDQVFVFAYHQPDYEFSLKDLNEWLVDNGVYPDTDAAQKINPQLYQRRNLFAHTGRGRYGLTPQGIERAEEIARTSR